MGIKKLQNVGEKESWERTFMCGQAVVMLLGKCIYTYVHINTHKHICIPHHVLNIVCKNK